MPRFPDLLLRHRVLLFILLAVLVVAGVMWETRPYWLKPDPLLTTPTLALESLQAKSLYFNGGARPFLIKQRPDLLTVEDFNDESDRTRAFIQAVQNYKLFRGLGRKYHFDAVLLTGDPSSYKPLLDHLIETKDWTLRYADHTSLVFRRDSGKAWEPADFTAVRERLAKKSAWDRATALAQTAIKLVAAGEANAGHQFLEEGAKLAPKNPEVANGLAVYHLKRGEWREAFEQVERALAADKKFIPALATKTQLLYGTKHYSEAYELSRKLIALLPEDPGLLFYHAKIAHEAHAYKAEIEVLEKLIKSAEAEGRPYGGYQLYLGQAYAATGDAQRSIDNFALSLQDPDLPEDQRSYAKENIARIKSRMER